ncbi:MAG: hypothetical protein ACJ748_16445 [Flavisolibacter sp.]
MDTISVQQKFFLEIKNQLPSHLSLVDEIADLLNISPDSAYRRIRGEKPIDFEEIKKLVNHYKLSLDHFFHLDSNAIVFSDRSVSSNVSFHFDLYLQAVIEDLTYMNSFENKRLYHLNKDVPIFHHFVFPELAAFKCFFWRKSIVHDPVFSKEKFVLSKYTPLVVEAGKKINALFAQLPTVEIWNVESIHSTLRQIEYYKNSGMFESRDDLITIYERLYKVIEMIEFYAENGDKHHPDTPLAKGADYKMYINEFILGDNTILVELNDKKLVYINHGVINYMKTTDEKFCAFTYDHFQNIIKRSTPISGVNEKERSRFFNKIKEKITTRQAAIYH